MKRQVYSPEEMRGKFIVCSRAPLVRHSLLECVKYRSGERSGLPYLYDSEEQAKSDYCFDELWDEVIPAEEYFSRKETTKKQIVKPNKNRLSNQIKTFKMKTKHTEGKWFTGNSGGIVKCEKDFGYIIICTLANSPLEISREVKANARLIAAAPDLLRSLEYAIKFIRCCPKITEEEQPKGLEKWEEIIKKATEE